MSLSKKHQALLKAVRSGSLQRVKSLLAQGYDPNPGPNPGPQQIATPLHDAVRLGHLSIVKVLIEADADINALYRRKTPLDLALEQDFELDPKAPAIIKYLKAQGALRSSGLDMPPRTRPTGKKPHIVPKKGQGLSRSAMSEGAAPDTHQEPPVKFTEEKLKDIFNPESWVGRTGEMEKLWEDVPKKLKAKFDFEAALAQAQRDTMHSSDTPAAKRLRKKL